eukprot:CAMPEP_0179111320 /NCGR_PEP_ID=MMETSP0796-20121207/51990_1 /TAXON_ID=73915 /ORGANISM="Pyrodinium bahamense, Strain pbaha01" /LENGTH=47 /DNA_ID= /DNA_START= /DNA_END= /DNA_ORIENTATION=
MALAALVFVSQACMAAAAAPDFLRRNQSAGGPDTARPAACSAYPACQ